MFSFFKRLLSSEIPVGSRPFNGSSKIKTSGSFSNTIAKANLCFIPSEKFLTFFLPVSLKFTIAKTLSISLVPGIPFSIRITSRFCLAVISIYNAGFSIVYPIFFCNLHSSFSLVCPNNLTFPSVGFIS